MQLSKFLKLSSSSSLISMVPYANVATIVLTSSAVKDSAYAKWWSELSNGDKIVARSLKFWPAALSPGGEVLIVASAELLFKCMSTITATVGPDTNLPTSVDELREKINVSNNVLLHGDNADEVNAVCYWTQDEVQEFMHCAKILDPQLFAALEIS